MLAHIGDRIYAGYGDFTENTGPIHIESVPASDPLAAWTDHLVENTEQILVYRDLGGGRIGVPQADPRGGSTGGFAIRESNGTWADHGDSFIAEHVFGMAEVSGHLFACGAEGGNAVVWGSTDGGATWGESLRSETSDLEVEDFERFYMLAVVGSSIYVQSSLGLESYEWTVGDGWTPADADLVIGPKARGAPGVIWRDGYIYPDYTRIGSDPTSLYYFDGDTRTLLSADVCGYAVAADGSLYVLDSLRQLRRIAATGSLTPTTLGRVERIATERNCSLCIVGDMAVVGTDQSRLKVVTLP